MAVFARTASGLTRDPGWWIIHRSDIWAFVPWRCRSSTVHAAIVANTLASMIIMRAIGKKLRAFTWDSLGTATTVATIVRLVKVLSSSFAITMVVGRHLVCSTD